MRTGSPPAKREMKKLLIVWGNWGPYHYARFRALHEHAAAKGMEAHGLELFPSSGLYEWKTTINHPAVHHLRVGKTEMEFNLPLLIARVLPLLFRLKPDVILVPSYWHWSLFINLAGRLGGAKIVMMNESHAGTQKARGLRLAFKKAIVRRFHSALVGGSPHRRHFAALGLDPSRIHLGYDAVDHAYFELKSEAVRQDAAALRRKFELPGSYFLNLGRMVRKKNLGLLIEAFALLRKKNPVLSHDLVLVGSGEESESLRARCRQLNLRVIDHEGKQKAEVGHQESEIRSRNSASHSASPPKSGRSPALLGGHRHDTLTQDASQPAVHFYGFRQIDENPVFYALAHAFILPSSLEEWGLVVNEAMACGLPVIVSESAGCAEDLVRVGRNGFTFNPGSVDELATAMAKLADPSIARSMGRHSLEIARHWGCDRFASGALRAVATATEVSP